MVCIVEKTVYHLLGLGDVRRILSRRLRQGQSQPGFSRVPGAEPQKATCAKDMDHTSRSSYETTRQLLQGTLCLSLLLSPGVPHKDVGMG